MLFRRQGANHLLIVGQNDERRWGAGSALLSLAAQYPPPGQAWSARARFLVLDGTPEDHPRG